MPSITVTSIVPEMFVWARQTVGLSQEIFAQKVGRPIEEIKRWESGEAAPTYAQLEKIAYQICKRPLATFFLPAPPDEILPNVEFRTLPDSDLSELSPNTYLHIRKAHAFQIGIEDLLGENNTLGVELQRLNVVVDLSSCSIKEQALRVREWLGVSMNQQKTWANDDVALKAWRTAIENHGIFVFKESFKQDEISGFCLSQSNYPVIYLNNSTSKTRQIFSLLHELAHVLLNINGLSKFEKDYITELPINEQRIERFCNKLAADILIPSDEFLEQTIDFPEQVDDVGAEHFALVAKHFNVSREVILRRFKDLGRVTDIRYQELRSQWNAQQRKSKTAGGSYYNTQGVYLSEKFSNEVISRHLRQQLTLEQAAEYLGLKPKVYNEFESRFLQGVTA